MNRHLSERRKDGQTLIIVLMIMIFLLLVALWQFDLHKILFVKHLSRNAGDSAALAAARWQGQSLNLIGELNVMQAISLSEALAAGDDDFSEAEAIADLQSRINFVGPLTGLLAAQQAAKNNRIYVSEEFTERLEDHIREILEEYADRYPIPPWGTDPAQTWQEYANMLSSIAFDGIAADPENRKFYLDYANQNHLLLNPSFYDAIASEDWCWFLHNAFAELNGYTSFTFWDDLPLINEPEPVNSEYYGLQLRKVSQLSQLARPGAPLTTDDLDELVSLLETLAEQSFPTELVDVPAIWFCYRDQEWSSWDAFLPNGFPFATDIKPQYNYRGADAAARIETRSPRLTPGSGTNEIQWTAAAKPFGAFDDTTPPAAYALVLPVFTDTRLIPVDSSSAPSPGSRPGWAKFIYDYLPLYMAGGPNALPDCWYCEQLMKWENSEFRNAGITWLEENSADCQQPGGPGPGGGTRRGH